MKHLSCGFGSAFLQMRTCAFLAPPLLPVSRISLRKQLVGRRRGVGTNDRNLVDPASSHMLVSKIKPCMSQYKSLHVETANGSLKQL